jgi:hypothetical protein
MSRPADSDGVLFPANMAALYSRGILPRRMGCRDHDSLGSTSIHSSTSPVFKNRPA